MRYVDIIGSSIFKSRLQCKSARAIVFLNSMFTNVELFLHAFMPLCLVGEWFFMWWKITG